MDTEKHIYKPIKLCFNCIQPIKINSKQLISLFQVKTNEKLASTYKDKNFPCWINGFNKQLFHSIYSLKTTSSIEGAHLSNELATKFKVNDQFSLTENLNTESTTAFLLFDKRLMYFNLVFQLNFEIDQSDIEQLVSFSSERRDKKDLYNTVRNILVKENDDSITSVWAETIKKNAKSLITEFIADCYDHSITSEQLSIENNTGNISCFVTPPSSFNEEQSEQLQSQFIDLNNHAERIRADKQPLVINENTSKEVSPQHPRFKEIFHFNGRFHTIITQVDEQMRFMPINFHMQFMWFYLKEINIILEENYNGILFSDSLSSIKQHGDITNTLINKIETLIIHNEKFKLTIESDNERIYQKIQTSWNIEGLLKTSERYIRYFKEHLNRLYSRKSAKAEQRQNSILLSITLLQFIALLSVWNDYLALLNDDVIKNAEELTDHFISASTLSDINLFLPVFFLIIIISMFLYIFRKDS